MSILEAIDDLRQHLSTMTRAWNACQSDPDREAATSQHLYLAADAAAQDVGAVLAAMAREAWPDVLALGLDPEDRDGLRWSVTQGVTSDALAFVLACADAAAAFRYWQDHDDHGAALDRVTLTASQWLLGAPPALPEDDTVRQALAEGAEARQAHRAQNAGRERANHQRASKAQQRAEAARAACGTDDLLEAARELAGDALAALAQVYGWDDPQAFQREAGHNNGKLRKLLERDADRL
ncbi:hypothetical protein OEZ49_07285 [Ruegeria sp. WL0004]|uniref:Uncharacterized protein n=1 Tax=Ruegeria marisflavi TaxID=2984152 RepID=A0ABT2WNU9_9RHOB|nr:hypothetical protein [Ruegeria sp. WL0004]MCU9837566.1 hypothetical protein [Ruegeria sp. WL0004]